MTDCVVAGSVLAVGWPVEVEEAWIRLNMWVGRDLRPDPREIRSFFGRGGVRERERQRAVCVRVLCVRLCLAAGFWTIFSFSSPLHSNSSCLGMK